MLRILATIGYGAVAFVSIFLVNQGDNPYLWTIAIAIGSPIYWFLLVGVPAQWGWDEAVGWLTGGVIGMICVRLMAQAGVISYNWVSGSELYLFAFCGAMLISAWKVMGTLSSWIDTRRSDSDIKRYTVSYLRELSKPGLLRLGWRRLFGVLGIIFVVWQLVRVF